MQLADRKALVTRHTDEVVTEDELETLLADGTPSVYVGYAPTGEMHIGHFTTIRKLADFLTAGLEVTVLIADLHAHLDDEKVHTSYLRPAQSTTRLQSRPWLRRLGQTPTRSSLSGGLSSSSANHTP